MGGIQCKYNGYEVYSIGIFMVKCQLPGPQQGTDRESQKPEFGK